ncbi:MAG TPA: c-type cytochrome, partial [Egibacteraceae bacterium]|nr:c-type cytochrome [Egibacteraceae bacterium]
ANCAMCHGANAEGMMGMHPALGGVIDRLTREGVEVTVRNGRDTMPPMPAFGDRLTGEEISDVIAYLDSLPPGPRNFGPEGTMGEDMPGGMMDRMDQMMGGDGGGLAAMLAALIALLAVLVAAAVIVAVVAGRRQGSGVPPGESAREILDRRYAAGELSADEYRQRRTDLES